MPHNLHLITTALLAVSSSSIITSVSAEPTHYQLVNFYAGSGPKSSFTSYSFNIGLLGDGDGVTNPAQCSAISSSNWHDGFIASILPRPCSSANANYTFWFSRVGDTGYWLNLTDADGARGSTFYPQSLVHRVQNNADPEAPDPFPNYALSDMAPREVERMI